MGEGNEEGSRKVRQAGARSHNELMDKNCSPIYFLL